MRYNSSRNTKKSAKFCELCEGWATKSSCILKMSTGTPIFSHLIVITGFEINASPITPDNQIFWWVSEYFPKLTRWVSPFFPVKDTCLLLFHGRSHIGANASLESSYLMGELHSKLPVPMSFILCFSTGVRWSPAPVFHVQRGDVLVILISHLLCLQVYLFSNSNVKPKLQKYS